MEAYDNAVIKNNRVLFEKKMLKRLKKLVSEDIKVTILADRGFSYVELYRALKKLGFSFVIRFRGNKFVYSSKNAVKTAQDWVGKNGVAKRLENPRVTESHLEEMPVVVCTQDKEMKDAWCLVGSDISLKTREIINFYASTGQLNRLLGIKKIFDLGWGCITSAFRNRPDGTDYFLLRQ